MTTLTTSELGERWGMNPGTLANWRMFKRGPKYSKKGTRVIYDVKDIEAFERASVVEPRVETRLPKKKKIRPRQE